jgi:ABC-2 type transport system permease protein
MIGKTLPYIAIAYIQIGIVYGAARLLFEVPMVGSHAVLALALMFFIVATLAVGFTCGGGSGAEAVSADAGLNSVR